MSSQTIQSKWGVVGVALLSLAFLPTGQALAVSVEELVVEAGKARQAGDLERTVRLLLAAYDVRPMPAVLNNLGRVYEEMGRYGDAVEAYRRVVDDQAAPETLRAMDAGRMSALAPRIGKAWILPEVTPPGSKILVDGQPTGAPQGTEFAVSHGEHTFEVTTPDGRRLWIHRHTYPLDRRTTLSVDLLEPTADMAAVLWQQLDPPVITLTVDGYGVRSELAGLERLMMVPGSHDVAFGRGQAGTVKATVVLETEGQVRLEDALDRPMTLVAPSGTTAAGPLAVGSRLDVPGPSVWPWVTTGVGVAGLGAGVWLLMQAEADRAPAETDAAGVALETTQAEDAARWDQANETAFQGSLLAGVGGALVLGGLTWWWLEDDASPVAIAPTPGGVIVGGRF